MEETPTTPEARPGSESATRPAVFRVVFALIPVAVVATAVVLTWLRLFIGMDLRDESFYVLVPWRWALGDKPFVQEQVPAQIPGFLMYPFVKLFAVLRDYDVTGYVLYMRHLYLLMMIGIAVAVFLLLRGLVRWELGTLAATVYVTYIFWATPQLSYNTMALAFLTLSATLGSWVVVAGKGRGYAMAAGAALGLAVVAYPSLLFIVPFCAVFFVFAHGRRAAAMVAQGAFVHPPDPEGPPTGKAAWRSLSAWVLGGALVLVPLGLVMLSFGPRNLLRSWQGTMSGARLLHQLGGASKALEVAQGFWRFFTWRPYLIVAALLVYLVFLRWPRVGRALLAALPVALWLAAQRPMLWASGYVQIYAFMTPYLYLFIPRERRETGAKFLIWVWAPAMIAGAMTAYTSAAGFVNSAVGFAPALVASGLFLAWALEAVGRPATTSGSSALVLQPRHGEAGTLSAAAGRSGLPWLALAALIAIVGVTIVFQLQFQQRDVPYAKLTSRFDSGPWWGIKVTPERRRLMDGFAADLHEQALPDDKLLVIYEGSGYYLYWNGGIAASSYWIGADPATGQLPQSMISYYRRHHIVPTLVVNLIRNAGMTDAKLLAASGGLDYPPTLVRPTYAFQRKPADESTAEVLARLPRR
jgi:hypothetical protein